MRGGLAMRRRFFIQGMASILPTLRFIGGQFVDVAIELRAAALRGELDGTEDFWAGGPVKEELGPIEERARFGPIVGFDGSMLPEKPRFA